MILREQYEEHSERDFLSVPLGSYHFDDVVIPLHWHREVEWILTEQGGLLEVEGENYPYYPGDMLCVNTGLLHRTMKESPVIRADLLVLDLRILTSPLLREEGLFLNKLEEGALRFPLRLGKEALGYQEITEAFRESIRQIREKPAGWECVMERQLLLLLEAYWRNGHLQDSGARPHNPQTMAVKESIAFMRRNYDQDLSLGQLAEQAVLSPSHYIRVFRHYTGQTPFAFLNDIRMEEAARFLAQSMTVSETALRVGIPNLSYFIRLFRQKYGLTPKQYQKEQSTEKA